MRIYRNIFNQIVDPEKLFSAWDEFRKGKSTKRDVLAYKSDLESNILQLSDELKMNKYIPGAYSSFYVSDPKQRHIHKASVGDRILHHAIFTALKPIFEPTFIANSFSCREGKGTHKGVEVLGKILRRVSKNGNVPCFALKCDIKKFFDSVNHLILMKIIERKIKDQRLINLLENIIKAYTSKQSTLIKRRGIPIGNLTSQMFANIYMNEFDQYIKHELKVKNYLRYTDDFIIISGDLKYLQGLIYSINSFLKSELDLNLHPKKVFIRSFYQGIDFLGYVIRPHYKIVRTKTKRRAFKKVYQKVLEYKKGVISKNRLMQTFNSYLGVFSHAQSQNLSKKLRNHLWFWLSE